MNELLHYYHIRIDPPEVIAGAHLEEGVDFDYLGRANVADPVRTRKGKPLMEFRNFNRHAEAEREATTNACDLAIDKNNLIFWFSPQSDVYPDVRMNVYLVENIDDEVALFGRGIPLPVGKVDLMKLANRLLESGGIAMDPIYDLEDLRRQPIGFEIADKDGWIDECRKLMPEFDDLWKFFEVKGEIKRKERMIDDVKMAMSIARGDNRVFEMQMARMGNIINPVGSHGGSWMAKGAHGGMMFQLDAVHSEGKSDKLRECPICGLYFMKKKGSCPNCNKH